jgi:hypothetical protein
MAATGRRSSKRVIVTPAMIDAGVRNLVFGDLTDDRDVVWNVLVAVLEAGAYEVEEAAEPELA